jgi:hypothetical protein
MLYAFPTNTPSMDEVVKRQKDFLKAFVDLKVEGYKSYTKALDNVTYSFFTTYTKEAEKFVVGLGHHAKEAIDFKMPEVYGNKK